MRPMTRTTIFALTAAAIAAPAVAATDMFLQLPPPKAGENAAAKGRENKVEVLSFRFGAARKGWDGTIKGGSSAAKYGAVSGAHRDDSLSPPPERGSVRIKVKFPWLDCAVGAAIPDAMLQADAARYELKDIQVTGCAPDSVDLDYAKVKVRAWDPSKKEN